MADIWQTFSSFRLLILFQINLVPRTLDGGLCQLIKSEVLKLKLSKHKKEIVEAALKANF
jgi:hypothetical protein